MLLHYGLHGFCVHVLALAVQLAPLAEPQGQLVRELAEQSVQQIPKVSVPVTLPVPRMQAEESVRWQQA